MCQMLFDTAGDWCGILVRFLFDTAGDCLLAEILLLLLVAATFVAATSNKKDHAGGGEAAPAPPPRKKKLMRGGVAALYRISCIHNESADVLARLLAERGNWCGQWRRSRRAIARL